MTFEKCVWIISLLSGIIIGLLILRYVENK